MPSQRDLAGAALLGAAGGMRTMTPAAALAARGRLLPGSPARFALLAAAAGEYAGDKAPVVPPRTSPPALIGRTVSGAFSGRILAGTPGAVVGGAAAAASTVATYRARKALGELTSVPDPVLGVAEDGMAIAAAALATRPRAAEDEPADEPKVRRIARGVVRGVAAGAFGTAVMTGVQMAVLKATGGEPSHAPEQVGRTIAKRVFGTRVKRSQRGTLNQTMHWLYGTGWGVPFGVLAAAAGRRPHPLVGGLEIGLSVWGAGLAQMPAFGVAPVPWEMPAASLATDAAYHLVYGVAVASALRALP